MTCTCVPVYLIQLKDLPCTRRWIPRKRNVCLTVAPCPGGTVWPVTRAPGWCCAPRAQNPTAGQAAGRRPNEPASCRSTRPSAAPWSVGTLHFSLCLHTLCCPLIKALPSCRRKISPPTLSSWTKSMNAAVRWTSCASIASPCPSCPLTWLTSLISSSLSPSATQWWCPPPTSPGRRYG